MLKIVAGNKKPRRGARVDAANCRLPDIRPSRATSANLELFANNPSAVISLRLAACYLLKSLVLDYCLPPARRYPKRAFLELEYLCLSAINPAARGIVEVAGSVFDFDTTCGVEYFAVQLNFHLFPVTVTGSVFIQKNSLQNRSRHKPPATLETGIQTRFRFRCTPTPSLVFAAL